MLSSTKVAPKVDFIPPAWQQTSCKNFTYFFFYPRASIILTISQIIEMCYALLGHFGAIHLFCLDL